MSTACKCIGSARTCFLTLLFAAVSTAATTGTANAQPDSKKREPILLAHRGLVRHTPENTLPAFAAAVELGLSIELDVYQTLDKQLVVIHDNTVDRTTNGSGKVTKMTFAEIRQLDAGSWFHPRYAGLKVPTLEEAFQLIRQRQRKPVTIALNMKIISPGIEANIVKLVEKYELFDQLFAFGQPDESSRRFKQTNPKLRTTEVKIYDSEHFTRALKNPLADCLWVGFIPSREEMNEARKLGKQVWLSFHIGNKRPDIWDKARASQMDGICTDWPLECHVHWRNEDARKQKVHRKPKLDTGTMGGVDNPTKDQLLAMHKSQYILHARGGKLTRVPVQKTWLPADPADMSHQEIMGRMVLAEDGTVIVMGRSRITKSSDGGRTWVSYPHDGCRDREAGKWGAYPDQVPLFVQALKDGKLIGMGIPHAHRGEQYWTMPANVWASSNEGKHWEKIAQIERPKRFNGVEYEWWYASYAMHRLPDGTLLWPVQLRNTVKTDHPYKKVLVIYRSSDGGKTWQGPRPFADWSSEGGMSRTASGKLLATVRYQRAQLPTDPPDLIEHLGSKKTQAYKHVFLIESTDAGKTWTNFRLLMCVHGQCYGFPVALPDGRVVVHTTPYGPGPRGSRAMISYDEGTTWEDEAYYLTFSEPSGYNQSVALKDGTILTVASRHDFIAPWGTKTEMPVAIRWKPVKLASADP